MAARVGLRFVLTRCGWQSGSGHEAPQSIEALPTMPRIRSRGRSQQRAGGSSIRLTRCRHDPHFDDAQAVGDAYRAGHVVELLVEAADAVVACGVVDFATGVVYGDRGRCTGSIKSDGEVPVALCCSHEQRRRASDRADCVDRRQLIARIRRPRTGSKCFLLRVASPRCRCRAVAAMRASGMRSPDSRRIRPARSAMARSTGISRKEARTWAARAVPPAPAKSSARVITE